MTRFAFGAKWGRPARPPVLGSIAGLVANNFGSRSDASAAMPMPVLVRPKNWRRVRLSRISCSRLIASLFRNHFVQIEDRTCDRSPGGELRRIQLWIARLLADGQQLERGLAVLAIMAQLLRGEFFQNSSFLRLWTPRCGQAERELNALCGILPALA